MGSVLGSFGAFQGNIWSVTPFIPVGPDENYKKNGKNDVFSKSPNGPILKFLSVVQNIVFLSIHSKGRPNNLIFCVRVLVGVNS